MTHTEIKNADEGVQNAFKNGKNSTKNTALNLQVCWPDKWQEHFATVTDTLSQSKTRRVEGEWFTRGELEQKKGYEETERHIAAGKYSSDEDSDGERIFRKKRKIDRSDEVTPLTIMIIVIVVMIIMIVDIVILHVDAIAVREPQLRS